ncbi:hypothetical protein CEN44_20325, partial [Fischerella muscicola CCMEE 5323]
MKIIYGTNVLKYCRIKYLSQPSTVSEQWFDTARNTSLAFMLKQSQSQECKLWNLSRSVLKIIVMTRQEAEG